MVKAVDSSSTDVKSHAFEPRRSHYLFFEVFYMTLAIRVFWTRTVLNLTIFVVQWPEDFKILNASKF